MWWIRSGPVTLLTCPAAFLASHSRPFHDAQLDAWSLLPPLGSFQYGTAVPGDLIQAQTYFSHFSYVGLFVTPWTAAHQASLSITNFRSLLKLMSIDWIMPSNHLILCCPLLLPPSIFPIIRVFSNRSVLHIRWPNYWSFSIRPSNEYSGLISFRIDWLDYLLAVQGTLKSLLQHHSSKASVIWCSAYFIVQLSHPYMTTRKTIALTRQTFVSKVMCFLIFYLDWP